MSPVTTTPADDLDVNDVANMVEAPDEALVEDELLVEEISIDGMCGVY